MISEKLKGSVASLNVGEVGEAETVGWNFKWALRHWRWKTVSPENGVGKRVVEMKKKINEDTHIRTAEGPSESPR